MGGIAVGGGGHGGKKSLDSEIPLIPFIDLLLCCVMFLLVSAVWTQMARLNASQKTPGQTADQMEPPPEQLKLILQIQQTGFVLASSAGDRNEVRKSGANYDLIALKELLRTRRSEDPNKKDIVVAPEDGVLYKDVVSTMDLVLGEGYSDMTLQDGAQI